MSLLNPSRRPKLVTALIETFGFSPWLASLVALFLLLLGGAAILWVVLSAPPRTITITSGPPGSTFERYADAYRKELAEKGVTLKIVPSDGSLDNLQRLKDPKSGIDLGFVQGGLVGENRLPGLVSLGSISYQPLWLFYRNPTPITRLSELAGKRLGVGMAGSGVQVLARALLEANEITAAKATFVEQPGEAAGKDFQAGKLDALFLMGDSAPRDMLRAFLRAPDIQVYSFTQADAYVRRGAFSYLNKIVLPQGSFDFALNLPPKDIILLGPTVELVARDGLNSAISDIVIGAAQDTHGKSGLFAKRGEFPAPLEHEFPISDDAARYYKSGKGFTYKLISSFWVASLINRLLVAIVPILLVMIPAIRFLPVAYRWSVQLRLYRCYRPLLQLERDAASPATPTRTSDLIDRLDAIERDVNALRVPASFASQYYDLRKHVAYVRRRLTEPTPA